MMSGSMFLTIAHPVENANPRQQRILKSLPSITFVDVVIGVYREKIPELLNANKERSLVLFKEDIDH